MAPHIAVDRQRAAAKHARMNPVSSWLTLAAAPGIGAAAARRLLERFGSVEAVLAASRGQLEAAGCAAPTIDALHQPDSAALERSLAWLAQPQRTLLWPGHEHYPHLLAAVPGAPVTLFVDGDPALLQEPQIAIVGSRNPTHTGKDTAISFAASLARCGLIVTSGLARGIDAAAHEGALRAGGPTIAVCGTGPDMVYPAENRALAARIRDNGALVSEFPPGTPARAAHFPQRNRIIAALTCGTLVVEAAQRSGALITARYASEYGREVFAIPGSIHNPLARGCHRLLRDGAKLVESAADVLAELGSLIALEDPPRNAEPTASAMVTEATETLDADYQALLDCIGWEPTATDEIVTRSGLTTNEVSSMLLILELRGYVSPAPEGGFSRTRKSLNQ